MPLSQTVRNGQRIALSIGVVLTFLVAVALAQAKPASADTNCYANKICGWSFANYAGNGYTTVMDCNYGVVAGIPESNSAKNRCGDRAATFGWSDGDYINWKFCMNPGGDRPDPGRFNFVSIGAPGSRC
jgi:hypothetical protein